MATSAADWLSAIGTVGAVVVALATPGVAWLLWRRRRPKLGIELSGSEPNLRRVLDASSEATVAFWVRFTVTNSGRGTAQAVRAQLRRYWVRQAAKSGDDTPWVECAIDPQPLAWISRPYNVSPERREAVAIPAGSSDSATIALFAVQDAMMTLSFLDADYVPPSPPTSHLVEYRFEVSVAADNADLVGSHLWCERDPASGLLTAAGQGREPPSPAQTRLMVPRAGNPAPTTNGSAASGDGDG